MFKKGSRMVEEVPLRVSTRFPNWFKKCSYGVPEGFQMGPRSV